MTRQIEARELKPGMMARNAAYLPFARIEGVSPDHALGFESIRIQYRYLNTFHHPDCRVGFVKPETMFEVA